jgi:hypothetical protein
MTQSGKKVVLWSTVTVAGLGVFLAASSTTGHRVLGNWLQEQVTTWSSLGVLASGTAGGLAAMRRAGQAVRSLASRVSSAVRDRID